MLTPDIKSKAPNNIFVAIDFETAGTYAHSACSLGLARFENGKLTGEYYSLIRPPSSYIMFSNIHGLEWKDLKNAPQFPEIWKEAALFMDGANYLVAHNAPFDKRILYACCEHYECPVPEQRFLCTLKGSKRALPIEYHNLQAVSDYFGFELDHHNAASDARTCGRILCKLLKMGLEPNDMLIKNKN